MPTTTISIPAEVGAQLDAVAQGSSSQEVALRAIRAFLAAEDERRLTQEAIAKLDQGQGVDAEQVREEMIALLEQRGISRAYQEHIRNQVAAELAQE
jgi:predicted transcriptional regulator